MNYKEREKIRKKCRIKDMLVECDSIPDNACSKCLEQAGAVEAEVDLHSGYLYIRANILNNISDKVIYKIKTVEFVFSWEKGNV